MLGIRHACGDREWNDAGLALTTHISEIGDLVVHAKHLRTIACSACEFYRGIDHLVYPSPFPRIHPILVPVIQA